MHMVSSFTLNRNTTYVPFSFSVVRFYPSILITLMSMRHRTTLKDACYKLTHLPISREKSSLSTYWQVGTLNHIVITLSSLGNYEIKNASRLREAPSDVIPRQLNFLQPLDIFTVPILHRISMGTFLLAEIFGLSLNFYRSNYKNLTGNNP